MKKYFIGFVFAAMLAMFSSAQAAPLAVYYFDDVDEGFMLARVESFSAQEVQMAIEVSGIQYDNQLGVYIDWENGIMIFPPRWFSDEGFDSALMRDLGVEIANDFDTLYMHMYDASTGFLPQAIRTELEYLTMDIPLLSLDINRQLLELADDFVEEDDLDAFDPDMFPF